MNNLDRKRWAQLAQELQFSQLDTARKQADTWRGGLATLTTLLAAVLVVKGPADAGTLTTGFQILVAVLLGVALLLLLIVTIWLTRATAGPTGEGLALLTGEGLQAWTADEAHTVSRGLTWAPWLAAASVIVVAAALGVTWFAPAKDTSTPLDRITETGAQACGGFIGRTQTQLFVTAPAGGPAVTIPVTSHLVITPVTSCN